MYSQNQLLSDSFLQEKILLVVYHYVIGSNSQRYIDMLRGVLVTLFSLDQIDLHKFSFIYNFASWLEDKSKFSDYENSMYQFFFDDFVSDIKDGFDFGIL